MSEIVNYGIIGCGMMGQEHLRNIALLPDTRIAAILEPNQIMADAAKAAAPNARMCGSIGELLDVPGLDCLLIASPNHMHVAQFAEIAATRPLPILIEIS